MESKSGEGFLPHSAASVGVEFVRRDMIEGTVVGMELGSCLLNSLSRYHTVIRQAWLRRRWAFREVTSIDDTRARSQVMGARTTPRGSIVKPIIDSSSDRLSVNSTLYEIILCLVPVVRVQYSHRKAAARRISLTITKICQLFNKQQHHMCLFYIFLLDNYFKSSKEYI